MRRLPFIDWVRGFAVVAMVLWHTSDAWLIPGLKAGQGFAFLRFAGGLAAPSFLLLAGLSSALSSRPAHEPGERARRLRDGLGRGLEVWTVGYALRLQTWLVDAQAFATLHALRAWLPLAGGYAAVYIGAQKLGHAPKHAARWLVVGGCAVALGLLQVPAVADGRLARLLQVDVLQCIGASLCCLALLDYAGDALRRPLWLMFIGVGVACLSEPLASQLPLGLPVGIAAYLGRFRTASGVNPSLFPLFPWLAYACFGAAFGAALRRVGADVERRDALVLRACVLGAIAALATSESLPYVHRCVAYAPWTVAPIRTAFRTGIVFALLGGGFAWIGPGRGRVLTQLGRTSLRIYWAHMLFAYGVLGRPWARQLTYAEWLGGAGVVLFLMWKLSLFKGAAVLPPSGPKFGLEPRQG